MRWLIILVLTLALSSWALADARAGSYIGPGSSAGAIMTSSFGAPRMLDSYRSGSYYGQGRDYRGRDNYDRSRHYRSPRFYSPHSSFGSYRPWPYSSSYRGFYRGLHPGYGSRYYYSPYYGYPGLVIIIR